VWYVDITRTTAIEIRMKAMMEYGRSDLGQLAVGGSWVSEERFISVPPGCKGGSVLLLVVTPAPAVRPASGTVKPRYPRIDQNL
jgi:hypothetical protein